MLIEAQLLNNHSAEYLFNRIATELRHIDPEDFTRVTIKLLESGIE
jgi:hypothetical protein